MTNPEQAAANSGRAQELLKVIQAWQTGETERQTAVVALSTVPLDEGRVLLDVLDGLSRQVELARVAHDHAHQQEDTESWRSELMASRARSWNYPDGVGLLVCPSVLILTDGRRGVVLRENGGAKALPASTSASLMLLCQTIVMAENSMNEKEMSRLQQQRIESTSTSLSEIEIIR